MGLCLAKQLMSPQHSENNCHSKVHYFDFLVSCLYTFNPLSLLLKWVMTLVETTYRETWREVSQNYQHDKGKGVIHIRQMKLSWKLRNGNRKLRTTMSKALVEFY